jgi:carboxypeptidase Taq
VAAEAYEALKRRFRRHALLGEAAAMLHWDAAAMMPTGGAEARAEQLSALDLERHAMLADPALADLLDEAEAAADGLGDWDRANLRQMRRLWRAATALPPELVEALSLTTSHCEMVWRSARAADDFATLRPHLEAVLALVREKAAARADALGLSPYDALLDGYEAGLRSVRLDEAFGRLQDVLPDFLDDVLIRQARAPSPLPLDGPFPLERQQWLAEHMMQAIGFDFAHGRLDVSHHPFTGGVPDDVRLTTRYREDDFADSLLAVLHETGHAMYERGLPAAWRLQPVGEAMGMAVHESQSLIVEMQACRSDAFIGFLAGALHEAFGVDGEVWAPSNLARHLRRVERSLIRVDADEVSYPLHVILRYRLERAMIAGDLAVAELPGAWREGMRELIGIEVPDDRDGCMQDIHWMGGEFGYFPTYTLGAIGAAQLYAAARTAEPGLEAALGRGDFAPLMGWLARHVHSHGAFHDSADALLAAATGRPLDVEGFIAHLHRRYGET